jgi:hypothetical protein
MKRIAVAVLLVFAATSLAAQSAEVRVNTWYFGNFFQAPDGAPKENVPALGIEGRYAHPIRSDIEGYVYADYLHFFQEGFSGSPGLRFGVRSEARPHSWDVSAQLQKDRPAFGVGDEVDKADIARLLGSYDYRFTRDWSLGVDGTYERLSFETLENRDANFGGIGANVRYRGFGSIFSPEIGVAVGKRSVDDPEEDYGQRDLIVQLRSAPTPPLYLSLRFRHRIRDYSNVDREDTRDQIVFGADLKHNENLTWNLYTAWENSDSTRASRSFDTLLAMVGLTYRLR